jgi:type VI protein secretion system component Hcp
MRHLLRRSALAGLAIAAALVVASPASAAPDKAAGTLTIPEVGSSDILAWSWGITNTTTIGSGSGGAGAGKAKLADFHLTKRVNPLSTELFRAAATGSHWPEVTVSVPIGGPGTPFAIEYELRQVLVSSLQQSGSAGDATESVALTHGAFRQTIGTNSQFGWDAGS